MNLRRRLNWLFGWLKTVFKWLKVIYDNKWVLTALAGVVASAGIGTYQQMQMAEKDDLIVKTRDQVTAVANAYRIDVAEKHPDVRPVIKVVDCSKAIAEHIRIDH